MASHCELWLQRQLDVDICNMPHACYLQLQLQLHTPLRRRRSITTVLNCQQLRFYCAKMHLCIFLMAQFRTKINDIRKNNIACDCQPCAPLSSPLLSLRFVRCCIRLAGSLCCKTNNCGNGTITVLVAHRPPTCPARGSDWPAARPAQHRLLWLNRRPLC